MTNEIVSASLVKRLALSTNRCMPQGYFRSKLFIAPFTTNPLVAAAGPLLSLVERLCVSPTLPPITNIRENIQHELQSFHSLLNNNQVGTETTALANYLVCATIDELLGKSYLRIYNQPAEFQAFTPLSVDELGPEQHFFDIINYIKEHPHQYLDLLELSYYCLIAGFEGIEHNKPDGRHNLDNLIEEIFQLIKKYRANKTPELFKWPLKNTATVVKKPPFVIITTLSILLITAAYWVSCNRLAAKADFVQLDHLVTKKMESNG